MSLKIVILEFTALAPRYQWIKLTIFASVVLYAHSIVDQLCTNFAFTYAVELQRKTHQLQSNLKSLLILLNT